MLDFIHIQTGNSRKDREIEQLKADSANIAFTLMLMENETYSARKEVADLNFQLMISGVL